MKAIRPSKDALRLLREECTREQIAQQFKVSVSTVRRGIRYYGLQRVVKNVPAPLRTKADFDSGITIMDKAKRKLGARLTETRMGYKLDGRPANTDVILRAAGLS